MKYFVTGRIHPERADVCISKIELKVGEEGKASLHCDSSQVTVILDVPSVKSNLSARIMAQEFSQMAVNSLGFSLGSGYSIEMIQVIPENGNPVVYGVRDERLMFDFKENMLDQSIRVAAEDFSFRQALRDYSRALVDFADCAFYCYRAIEAIKSSFEKEGENEGWPVMHSKLGTNKEEIKQTVKKFSDSTRHGNWSQVEPTSSQERFEMLKLTRDILYNYIQFKANK